jgi:hypothetical protein
MINSLQVVTSIPLFTINFPGNFLIFLDYLVDIANFNLIPTSTIESKMFKFTNSPSFNNAFNQLGKLISCNTNAIIGYTSSNFFSNLGSFFLFIIILVGVVIGTILLAFCQKRSRL